MKKITAWSALVLLGLATLCTGAVTLTNESAVKPVFVVPSPTKTGSHRGESYYRDCKDARSKGAVPLRRGDKGYRPALDANHDGIACE